MDKKDLRRQVQFSSLRGISLCHPVPSRLCIQSLLFVFPTHLIQLSPLYPTNRTTFPVHLSRVAPPIYVNQIHCSSPLYSYPISTLYHNRTIVSPSHFYCATRVLSLSLQRKEVSLKWSNGVFSSYFLDIVLSGEDPAINPPASSFQPAWC